MADMTSQVTKILPELDPDDPRTPAQQIANALRAAILTGRLSSGDKLPSQHALARHYGVARETVKASLRILDRDRLIVSRQGSGAFVRFRREDAVDLQSFLRSAFDRPHVSIDYAGFTGEALSHTLTPTLHEVRAGRLTPTSLRVRVMLVDPMTSRLVPRPREPHVDDAVVRKRIAQITDRATTRVRDAVTDLAEVGLVESATVQVRTHDLGPMFKLYLVNDERALFGFYPVTEYHLTVDGASVSLTYPSGWDSTQFGDEPDARAGGGSFTAQARAWFESLWSTIAQPYHH